MSDSEPTPGQVTHPEISLPVLSEGASKAESVN